MTDQEINMAIAEACGWKEVEPWLNGDRCFELNKSVCGYRAEDLPDYCTDLNAMNEAEETLAEEQWESMFEFLIKIRWRDANDEQRKDYGSGKTLSPSRAKAKQRAEAFLKTVGKWKE